jgi:DNA invertase Pin-like site-specific DNA recombinase
LRIGYVRVSTNEQKTVRQEELLHSLDIEKIYIDKSSGKSVARPGLERMMDFVREGDTVIVESISRFARNARDLLELIGQLSAKDVCFVSKKESIDTQTPTGKFMLTVFAAVAELERANILQRQHEGIAIAKAQGKYKGRKAREYPGFEKQLRKVRRGETTAAAAMKELGMSKTTWYRKARGSCN